MPTLKPYQEQFCRERIERAFRNGQANWDALSVGLFSDMGTGKTPSTIMLIEWTRQVLRTRHAKEANWPVLIICQATIKWNWQNEINEFAPWIKNILIIDGTPDERREQLKGLSAAQYVIMNYEQTWIHRQELQDFSRFLAVIVDEAHAIKNRHAKRTSAIKSIDAQFRMALTGTPIINRPDDLWSILHFLYPGPVFYRKNKRYRGASPIWSSYWAFTGEYCEWKKGHFGSKIVGGKNLDQLHEKLLSTNSMVRWRRSEVLSLEPIVYKYIVLGPTPEQSELYRMLSRGFAQQLEESGKLTRKSIRTVLAQLTYFRRASTLTPREFALALGGQNPEFAPDLSVPVSDRGAKQEWLLSFLKNNLDGQKALVFSDWTGCTRPLVTRLNKAKISTVTIDGKTPHKDRFDIQEQFNQDDSVQVLVGSPAAYEGLNLQAASYVIFMNLPWSPKDIFQAYSRAHRMGQEGQVTVIFPLTRGTIDEKMAQKLRRKQTDIDRAIDNGEVNAAKLFDVTSKEEVLDMVGGSWFK
jgi:SNF2 family DNA or RNA helicase